MKASTFLKLLIAGTLALVYSYAFSSTGGNIGLNNDPEPDTTLCLGLHGKIAKSENGPSCTYTVELMHHNAVVDSKVIKAGKSFDFVLKENSWYGINIKKSGCVNKLISVSTFLPAHARNYFYKLSFEVDDLLTNEEASQLDSETLDFPMAIFAYDQADDNFYYNEEYSKNIKKVLLSTITEEPSVVTPLTASSDLSKKASH